MHRDVALVTLGDSAMNRFTSMSIIQPASYDYTRCRKQKAVHYILPVQWLISKAKKKVKQGLNGGHVHSSAVNNIRLHINKAEAS